MSDTPQQPLPGTPTKPSSGFVGNGGARERDEGCPVGYPESERTLPRRVSRETVDLNEILDRAMPKVSEPPKEDAPSSVQDPDGPEHVSRETDQEEKPAPSPGDEKARRRSSVYIYLAILFGAAFLMLLLSYFVQQRNNAAVQEDLRTTTASRQELLEEIEVLEEERDQLQAELEHQTERADQANRNNEQLQRYLEDSQMDLAVLNIQKQRSDDLWYIEQFMDDKDWPMAALTVVFNAGHWSNDIVGIGYVPFNTIQAERYGDYRQELIDRGYLQLGYGQLDSVPTTTSFTEQWRPSKNEDMAALGILWCALNSHFFDANDEAASQYLCLYPLGDPATGYQERVEQLASKFTLEQFQLLKDELVENGWLIIEEDGSMIIGPGPTGFRPDVLYTLPFDLSEG